jgi:small basic protein
VDVRDQLAAAASWLCRAQDATGNGGVARGYSLVYNRRFGRSGWQPAYPETTGYIIPTVFDYAHMAGRDELFDRALRMADWECDVQMPSGAVQGGTIDHEPTPAIFNTGQVIFGWVRAWQESGNTRYLECAVRAGDFLTQQQDPDGAWRRNLSRYASPTMPSYTYNTRTAWALLLLSSACGKREFWDAAIRNVEYALSQQAENGYYRNNCLDDSEQALLHTIAYCLRGILEVGILASNRRFLDSVILAADALLGAIRKDRSLAGRFDPAWKPTVLWSCLTGNSQLAVNLGRLYQVLGARKYLDGLKAINAFQRSVQILNPGRPDIHGGVCGSYPVHGKYGEFEIASWGVKFFMDALMIELEIAEGKTLLLGLPDRHGVVRTALAGIGYGSGRPRGGAPGDDARRD